MLWVWRIPSEWHEPLRGGAAFCFKGTTRYAKAGTLEDEEAGERDGEILRRAQEMLQRSRKLVSESRVLRANLELLRQRLRAHEEFDLRGL